MELKCHLCREVLRSNRYCACALGDHLLSKHPGARLTYFSNNKLERDTCRCHAGKGTVKYKGVSKKKSGVYKTTGRSMEEIETWTQGTIRIKCPHCEKIDKPCLRKQTNKVATSQIGAYFLLTCWPLCFLPFLKSGMSVIDLYCKHCGTYLGEYDRRTGVINCPCVTGDKNLNTPCNTEI